MNKPIVIIAGEPNSISSEIIFKTWKLIKNYRHNPIIIIGSINLLNLQKKFLKLNIKIKKINKNFTKEKYNKNELLVYDVKYNQKKAFDKISSKSNKYILSCFKIAVDLAKKKKILGIINCPVSKENLFKKKHQGITEFLAKKIGLLGNEVMLIYNSKLSVSPLTTHISLLDVTKNIKKRNIIHKVKVINKFFRKNLKKKLRIGILGLNPHNFSGNKKKDKHKEIIAAIKVIKKLKIRVNGPIPTDTSFMNFQKYKVNVILGMYHDQVLTPFKTLFEYDAINITLGLPFIRISPDHGTAGDIAGKKIADPTSLVKSILFFNLVKNL